MKTIQVSNGDIVLDSGGRLQFVVGTNKLVQDLALWLEEQYGIGFTTPNFGSMLYSMIGGPITSSTLSQVQAEIQRILALYSAQQLQTLQNLQQSSQLSYYNKSEIIQSIGDITVLQGTGFINANVAISTLNGQQLNLNLLITSNGIQVNSNG
jgi:phage baseplate assembly protein W